MDEEQEDGVLSILRGRQGWNDEYSSISEFKHHLNEDALVDEKLEGGWVLWRENEQQLNNTTLLQHKITTLFKHLPSSFTYIYYYMVQFWSVVKVEGRRHYLSTSHHPFFVSHLKKGYCWYRKLCMDHVYPVCVEEDGPVEEVQLGGVGRSYRNKHPESTPDLRLYSTSEFPLRDHAARFRFRFYLALPLFDLHTSECCGVLELLSDWAGMEGKLISSLYQQLQIAGLRSTHINFIPISSFENEMPDKYKQQVDTEIRELLETVIQALPRLSLAQVWVYCKQCVNIWCMERASFITASSKKVNSCTTVDGDMLGYLKACEFHQLQLDCNHFHPNLKDRSISKSPLEHYAQRERLSHRFAIFMQSVDNSNDPFVLEFFLKPERSSLHLLSRIIQMKLKSFKCVWWEQQLLESFQPSQPNEIKCESMNSYKENFSESNFKEYMDTVDDSCCLRPASTDSPVGWVFSCPSRERLCESHLNSNTLFVPVRMMERIEEFMKKMAIQYATRSYWIVQFWAPKMAKGRCYLETSARPYALGCLAKGLASFRKECMKHHYFVDDEAKEQELGPPGRVFRNKHPEITPDLLLYSTTEFPMKNHAMHCCLQKYLVLPVLDERKHECAGVLEFIGFDYFQLEDIGRALKAAELWSTDHIHFHPRFISHKPATIINCRKKYSQMEHQQGEEPVEYVSDGMTEQCSAAASVSKKTEKGKRKNGIHLSLEDLEPHFGKKLKDVAEELGVSRSTIKRACRVNGVKRWPRTKKQTKNPCINEKEKQQDSHQDVQPSSSGSLELLDTSLHHNGPCTNTESLIVQEEVEKVMIKVRSEEIIKFELCLPLGVGKLFKEVATRLNLKMGTFKLKYLDEDKDEISITFDDDLELCLRSQIKMGKTCIELLLRV